MKLVRKAWQACVALPLFLTQFSGAAQTVTVDLDSPKQTIRGFGGMLHRNWQGYDLSATDRALAFGNGPGQIGLSVLRIPVNELESDWSKELATAKDVIARGGIVYASPWNPPSALKTPYSFTRWGTTYNSYKISAANYGAYAAHLNKFAKYMKDNGAPLYALSMQNEPDWCDAWTCWSATEVYDFVKNYGASLRQQGTKVISAESFAYSKSLYDPILNDPAALNNVDILGAHFYGTNYSSRSDSTRTSYFQYPLADQKAAGKERWMTEHYTDSKGNANLWRGYIITGDQDQVAKYDTVRALDVAYEIHRAFTEGNFNQYTWWYIRRNYGLIIHDASSNVKPATTAAEVGKVSKRGYCVAQYAKFVRPGFVRVAATANPDQQVYVSAYKKADSVVIVAVNRAGQKTVNISIPKGTRYLSWKKYTTSATKNVNDDGAVLASNGNFAVSLDQESVTTLVGVPSATVSSSSVQVSSSSLKASSSSVQLSSSSVKSSSSSTQASSSSKVSSSSSATGTKACIAFVNGVGDYGNHCYLSGLSNMASNTCYTMNPARGTAPVWINNNANDTWWWVKASCSGIAAKPLVFAGSTDSPARYEVYDLQGQLHSVSEHKPVNLPVGSWILMTRDSEGRLLSRQSIIQR